MWHQRKRKKHRFEPVVTIGEVTDALETWINVLLVSLKTEAVQIADVEAAAKHYIGAIEMEGADYEGLRSAFLAGTQHMLEAFKEALGQLQH